MSPKRLVNLVVVVVVVVVVGSGQNKILLWDFDHWTKVRLRRDKYFVVPKFVFLSVLSPLLQFQIYSTNAKYATWVGQKLDFLAENRL